MTMSMVVIMSVMVMTISVMVVMVASVVVSVPVRCTLLCTAILFGGLKLKGGMSYSMFCEFMSKCGFNLRVVSACHDMHSSTVCCFVKAPDVYVMHVNHAVNLTKVRSNLIHVNSVRCFLEKQFN